MCSKAIVQGRHTVVNIKSRSKFRHGGRPESEALRRWLEWYTGREFSFDAVEKDFASQSRSLR
jgi:hypothetical protein